MTGALRWGLLSILALSVCAILAFSAAGALVNGTMPPYCPAVGNDNYTEKITGQYLLGLSSAQPDTLFIFGSSELRTTEVPTHPANFFAGKRAGFQVDLIGRGFLAYYK